MRATFTAIYHFRGASRFAGDVREHVILTTDTFHAKLTDDAEAAFEHLDRGDAIGRLLLTVLTGSGGLTPEQFIDARMAEAKAERAKKISSGLFLLIEAEREVELLEGGATKVLEGYGLALEAIDKGALKRSLAALTESVITAILASLPARADTQVVALGDIIILHAEQPLYAYSLGMTAGLSLSTIVGTDELEHASRLAKSLADNPRLSRSVHLHALAGTHGTDKLLGVLAAWTALEVFVGIVFKDHYNDAWYQQLATAAPGAAKDVVGRLEQVMSDKLRLADKFNIIASILDADGASADTAAFLAAKQGRDEFFHELAGDRAAFSVGDATRLYRKYLSLHVARISGGS